MSKLAFALTLFATALWFAAGAEAGAIKHVIVITMENRDAKDIYGNAAAPYINSTLMPRGAIADNFNDPLPDGLILQYLSEPHYVYMEAGTAKFANHNFRFDGDPSARNIAITSAHLVNALEAGSPDPKLAWMTYQEGIGNSGKCPVASSGLYAAKHNPFVFFADVAGNPPSAGSERCRAHTRDFSQFAADRAAGTLARYVFISPNLCNDMHGAGSSCRAYRDNLCRAKPDDPRCAVDPKKNVAWGDAYLQATLTPHLLDWAEKNGAAIFIVWDEPRDDDKMPFIALGAGVKPGYRGSVAYDHGSLIKTVSAIFGVPPLATVAKVNDFSDLFTPGSFP